MNQILAEYGPAALVVYLSLFFAVLIGAWIAIHLGWQPASTAGTVGVFTGAYLFTKVTQPVRIAATLAITPVAAKLYTRFRPPPPQADDEPTFSHTTEKGSDPAIG